MAGRPTDYTEALAEEICSRLAEGESLLKICKDKEIPCTKTIYTWLHTNEVFLHKYAKAREVQAHNLADEVLQISDDDSLDIGFTDEGKPFVKGENIQRSRLRADSRKWYVSKVLPKIYGDRIQQDTRFTDKEGNDLNVTVTITKKGDSE